MSPSTSRVWSRRIQCIPTRAEHNHAPTPPARTIGAAGLGQDYATPSYIQYMSCLPCGSNRRSPLFHFANIILARTRFRASGHIEALVEQRLLSQDLLHLHCCASAFEKVAQRQCKVCGARHAIREGSLRSVNACLHEPLHLLAHYSVVAEGPIRRRGAVLSASAGGSACMV